MLFCTPECAGTLPGQHEEPARLDFGQRVGARVLDDACIRIPVRSDAVGVDGLVADPELREALAELLAIISSEARATPA